MALHTIWSGLQHVSSERGAKATSLTVFAFCFTSLICLCLYRLLFHPLSHIPGPTLAKLTGLWRSAAYARGNWHDEILTIHKKYGRIVRIAPNELSIVDEQAMKTLYGHGHNAVKTPWYSVWDPPVGAPQLFSARDKRVHSFLRKRVASAYSMSSILTYETYIQRCLDLLLRKLKTHAPLGPVDMSEWTNAFAFDVVGELGYGSPLGMLETETDVNNIRRDIFGLFKMLSCIGHFPGQMWLVSNAVSATLIQLLGVAPPLMDFQNWTFQRVRHRLEHIDEVKREDMLQHFCRMKDEVGSPVQLSEIAIEVGNLIGAGADTTSIGMRACLYYVASHPQCYQKLQIEIDDYYLNSNTGSPISYLDTQKLPYLQAVIKEATRLLPSIVFQLLRHTPPDFNVRGIHIPAGTTVGISPIAQNRDQDIWGPDADTFRPDRWLEDPDHAKKLESKLMTFGGSGPRMFVGRNIAMVEMHKFLAQFVRHFEFEIANKEKPWTITTYWFAYQKELFMKLKLRKDLPL